MAPDISVVVLCYKAKEGIIPFVQRLTSALATATENYELVLVGNYNRGDTADTTPAVVRALAETDPRIKALAMEKRGWMGWDARSGLDIATGRVIALIDGDNQMPPEDVLRVYHKLVDEDLEIVTTYRKKRADGIGRVFQSLGYNLIFATLFPGSGVSDVNSKPKIMRRELFDKLHLTSDDWFLDAEMIIQVRRHKARIAEIPTVFLQSKERGSFVRLSTILEFVANLTRARIREFFIRP